MLQSLCLLDELQPMHHYNCNQCIICVVIVPIYIVVLTLVVLLQLAHGTSGNSIHFDFL
jgi:hypothetical protein